MSSERLFGSPFSRAKLRPVRDQLGIKVTVNESGFMPASLYDSCHDTLQIVKAREAAPKPTTEGEHMVSFCLTPHNEIDLIFLDVQILKDGGDPISAAKWFSQMFAGYGFHGLDRWATSPLWTWESRFIEMMFRGSIMSWCNQCSDMMKQHPELRGEIEKALKEVIETNKIIRQELIKKLREDSIDSFVTMSKSRYFLNLTNHRREARHLLSNEIMDIYMNAPVDGNQRSVFPKTEIVLGFHLTGILYRYQP